MGRILPPLCFGFVAVTVLPCDIDELLLKLLPDEVQKEIMCILMIWVAVGVAIACSVVWCSVPEFDTEQ